MPVIQTKTTALPEPGIAPHEELTPQELELAEPVVQELQAMQVATQSVNKLLAVVSKHKDVTGNALAQNGLGDPRLTERRSALSVLLSNQSEELYSMAQLKALSPEVAADIAWLQSADRKDYQVGVRKQFSWASGAFTDEKVLEPEFRLRVKYTRRDAADVVGGTSKYLRTYNGTMLATSYINDPEKRAAAYADLLLQFRGKQARSDDPEVQTRVDLIGTLAVAEQRIILSSTKLNRDSHQSLREYALLKLTIGSNPLSSINNIYMARNAVGAMFWGGCDWVKNDEDKLPEGATYPLYQSIHHNFSSATPRNVELAIADHVFAVGPREERAALFFSLAQLLERGRNGDSARLNDELDVIISSHPQLFELATALSAANHTNALETLSTFMLAQAKESLGEPPESNLLLAAKLYQAVCADRPNASTLEATLLKAGAAWPAVADVIAELRAKNDLGLLKRIGEARMATADAVMGAKAGFVRQEILGFDTQLERLSLEVLGSSVDRCGDMSTPAQQSEAMLALRTSLQCMIANGYDAIYRSDDSAAKKGRPISEILKDVNAAMDSGKTSLENYRSLMAESYVATQRIVQNMRSFFDARIAPVVQGIAADNPGLTLDPEFLDQLIKQSPMHYATALTQKGMRVGLSEVITAREVKNVTGMRVLNSVGPVVFTNVVFAEGTGELLKLSPKKEDLAILYQLNEKKMVAVGGLIADVKNAPGGNSHLNMYAMNNGITVLALPELRTKYKTFFQTAMKEGGIYCDDANHEFSMMTVRQAEERGLIATTKGQVDAAGKPVPSLEDLKPGTNKIIKYLRQKGDGTTATEVFAQHEAFISANRPVREIELYVPADEIQGMGKKAHSFLELSTLGTAARHLAGEKGTVLALLKAHPKLSKYVPDGSQLSPSRCRMLLEEAGILDAWEKPWRQDPKVGTVDDNNFMKSAFYTDANYRRSVREGLQHTTLAKLRASLISADGTALTAAGQKLYDELLTNPALVQSDNWITRSSFTGEDRPNKSGAGQYESFPNLRDPVARINGVIGVIESAWMAEPVENNVADQINLQHIMPSVTVMHCLKPTESGVMISRNTDNGARQVVSYQLVKGFGGGVEGGKTEEGFISAGGAQRTIDHPEVDYADGNGIVPRASLLELRDIVLEVEKFFDEVVEPGTGSAVDMEVARVDGQWQIVQARVIGMDK